MRQLGPLLKVFKEKPLKKHFVWCSVGGIKNLMFGLGAKIRKRKLELLGINGYLDKSLGNCHTSQQQRMYTVPSDSFDLKGVCLGREQKAS